MAYKMGLGAGRRGGSSGHESDWQQDQDTATEIEKRVEWRGLWKLFGWRWRGDKLQDDICCLTDGSGWRVTLKKKTWKRVICLWWTW